MTFKVIFYRPKSVCDPTLEKVVIHTGKTTVEEAYQMALENGHNPNKLIQFELDG